MRLAIIDDFEEVALDLADWDSLGPDLEIDVYKDHLDKEDDLIERLLPYDLLLIMRERTPFPKSLIQGLSNLKLLVTTGPRNHAIALDACSENGIVVCGTDSSKLAAAELSWALIMATLRRIPHLDRTTRTGHWGSGIGSGLSGKVLGVLGLGHIGTRITRVARAFDMEVIAWSQNMTSDMAAEAGAVRVEKDELFASADIITIHLVLSRRTQALVGAREIGLMKPTAYIFNTSRGPIIEEKALIDALRQGRIAGAGLDVFETEPLPPEHPLLKLDNVVLTPHIGYVTRENFQTFYVQAVEDIAAWLSGKPIRVLNP